MRPTAPVAIVLLLAAAGCANRPIPIVQDTPPQFRMEASRHWQILADQTANNIVRTLNELPPDGSRLPAEGFPPMYLTLPDRPNQFDRAFRDLLATELVSRNVPVAARPTPGVLTVSSTVEMVEYEGDANLRTFPGGATAVGTLGAVEYGLLSSGPVGAGFGVALGALAIDALLLHEDPDTEVIITTSLVASGGYLARKSSIYYVRTEDRGKYAKVEPPKPAPPKHPTRTVELTAQ